MFSGRGCGCSSRIALPIIAASGGSAPEWLDTSSAPPVGGHVLDPLHLGPEPVAVVELDQGPVHQALDPLRAPPVGQPCARARRPAGGARRSSSRTGGQRAARAPRGRRVLARAEGRASGIGHRRRFWQDADAGWESDDKCAPRTRYARTSGARWTAKGCRGSPEPRGGSRTSPAPRPPRNGWPRHSARWTQATTIKANPDSPQTHARRLALTQGKTLVMAVPRLRDQHPFRLLDPRKLDEEQLREAATIKGALRHGEVIDLDQVPELDLVLTGSVAVNLKGARMGKGGGFSDLEYGLLLEAGQDRPPHGGGHHRPPDPDPAREPADDRPRHPGGHRGHPARRDRGRRRLQAARRGSCGTTCSRRRFMRSRCWSGSGTPARPQSQSSGLRASLHPALQVAPVVGRYHAGSPVRDPRSKGGSGSPPACRARGRA